MINEQYVRNDIISTSLLWQHALVLSLHDFFTARKYFTLSTFRFIFIQVYTFFNVYFEIHSYEIFLLAYKKHNL